MQTLGSVGGLPLPERVAVLDNLLSGHAASAISQAENNGLPRGVVNPARLLEAVGYLINPPVRESGKRAKGYADADQLGPKSTTVKLVDWLVKPFRASSQAPSMPLKELVWSVGCEQRADWLANEKTLGEGTAVEDCDLAKQSLEVLLLQNDGLIEGYIQKNFRLRAGDPSDFAAQAWAEAFVGWWSPQATTRFAGRARIITAVCQIARNMASKEMSRPTRAVGGLDLVELAEGEFVSADVANCIAIPELDLAAYLNCLETLPVGQRLIVDLSVRFKKQNKEICEELNTSASNVSNQLTRGRDKIRKCLKRCNL
ncbi:MAG: sigma-70 family RNA polymerase sigma factor [Phycisphaeraceae bacterium]